IVLIAVGLSMDAFAVSVCKGISLKNANWKQSAYVGLWFGIFQALMPLAGYFAGSRFLDIISNWDHWIAFILLFLIGANMIREGISDTKGGNDCCDSCGKQDLGIRTMFMAAIATSIDALAVGVSFVAIKDLNIWAAVAVIGLVTFAFSAVGVRAGSHIGKKFAGKAEIIGGVILICIGLKIVLEHTLGL
ncbi:MAG: manganese efflux pump MntP family protein, partial [Candidatus Cryptobacteroides sp.]